MTMNIPKISLMIVFSIICIAGISISIAGLIVVKDMGILEMKNNNVFLISIMTIDAILLLLGYKCHESIKMMKSNQ